MDRRHGETAIARERDAAARVAVPAGMAICRCGAGDPGAIAGFVPDWFGRDCIEARCPLKELAA